MDFVNTIFDFLMNILNDVSTLGSWLVTKHDFLGGLYSFTPLMLIGIGGLLAYLVVAVARWII